MRALPSGGFFPLQWPTPQTKEQGHLECDPPSPGNGNIAKVLEIAIQNDIHSKGSILTEAENNDRTNSKNTRKANSAIEWLMRAGYGARGTVYFLVGAIAIFAAINGGEAEGTTGALNFLVEQPFGQVLLGIIAAGLFAYTAWRFTDAIMDLENEGDDAKGYAARAGQFLSGLTHVFLGISAVTIMIKGAEERSGNTTTENWTAAIMSEPFGRWFVAIAGAVTFGVGIYLFVKAWRTKYTEQIRNTAVTKTLSPLIRFGLIAHGIVLLLIGGLIGYAAYTTEPQHAAGLGEALRIMESQVFGRVLLGIIGAGMIGFAAYCGVRSVYGNVTRLSKDDMLALTK